MCVPEWPFASSAGLCHSCMCSRVAISQQCGLCHACMCSRVAISQQCGSVSCVHVFQSGHMPAVWVCVMHVCVPEWPYASSAGLYHACVCSRVAICQQCGSVSCMYVFQSGHMPAVRVWDLEDNNPIAQFSGHQFGINCVVSLWHIFGNNKHSIFGTCPYTF